MIGLTFHRLLYAATIVTIWTSIAPAQAAVERVEVQERTLFSAGKAFGNVGAYIRISGRLHYSVDPESEYNIAISDLSLAPVDSRDRVQFSGDFVLLMPLDPERGNGRLIYDVTNRGGMVALSRFNDGTGRDGARSAADLGNGFLFEQGYSLLWTGWNWDVEPNTHTLTIDLPIARQKDGGYISGRVISEVALTETASSTRHIPASSIGYSPTDMDSRNAQLSVRAVGQESYTTFTRDSWRFGRPVDILSAQISLSDPKWITLDSGFESGSVYRLIYQARNPRVVGLGLAAIRDALSFFRFNTRDSTGNQNPLLENGAELPRATIAYGASQSGRVLNTLIWYGLHVDEAGRMVFDGAMIDIAGAGKGGFNYRFAQTSRHFSHDLDLDFATDFFPFSTSSQTDSDKKVQGSLFDQARALRAIPRLFIVNTSTEYWTRSGSLTHTETDGSIDVEPDESVRIYMVAGGQHVIGVPDTRGTLVHCRNPLDYRPVLRALLSHLDAWITLDRNPPQSAYPRINDGTLVSIEDYQAQFPDAPFLRTPDGYLQPPRLDYGPRFETEGIADQVPPKREAAYITLIPAPDEDGLDQAGIRMPDIKFPLGTYTGWNPQNAATGAPDRLSRWFGSFIPFARTIPERTDRADPRPAITERYISRADYLESFAEATLDLANREMILGIDINPMIERAGFRFDQVMTHTPNDESCAYLAQR
ncbi:MAG: alpha/beta hydrolase domain-containing protein [Rhodospirillaceae bacterium]|nr:alpha/beta hydrolase domain-containing protein [Rhodospirillaceae bacterium]